LSSEGVAGVDLAKVIALRADDGLIDAKSFVVTEVHCAVIIVLAVLGNVLAAKSRVTAIVGAGVEVMAVLFNDKWSVDRPEDRITSVLCTLVVIVVFQLLVVTEAGRWVTGVQGALVVVVAVLLDLFALPSGRVATR